ncbi:GNAT family N-acetyltransferase [Chitinophaga rhizosphaerae]|uniref:GNAT family N-acetyltransferase n=1 Tax=Chitinophaga rhizosphaerae TaxID=1864947 RepID=UPI0013DEB5B6|nr:GNAT family N-acetyltransferase [Chitinophaga rhizosphaerae]
MDNIRLRALGPGDTEMIGLVAEWYNEEWNLPLQKTRENLLAVCAGGSQFQAVLTVGGRPVATGGVYHHVGLCDRVPRFRQYRHWLAMVYTVPMFRNQGYGAQLCRYLQDMSAEKGMESLYLFTDSAERLYAHLGWDVMERLETGGRNLVVMHLALTGKPLEHPAQHEIR